MDFDLIWPSINLRVTRGILVIFAKRGTSGCTTSFWMFSRSHGEKIIFLDFFKTSMQIEGRYYLTSWVQWEVSDKERDFRFCCLQICVRRLFMDRYQTLLDWTDLLQLLLKFFWACLWTLGEEKGVFFFFLGLTGGPRRCARQLRVYKCPILAHFSLFFHFSLLKNSLERSWAWWVHLFSFSPLF